MIFDLSKEINVLVIDRCINLSSCYRLADESNVNKSSFQRLLVCSFVLPSRSLSLFRHWVKRFHCTHTPKKESGCWRAFHKFSSVRKKKRLPVLIHSHESVRHCTHRYRSNRCAMCLCGSPHQCASYNCCCCRTPSTWCYGSKCPNMWFHFTTNQTRSWHIVFECNFFP